MPSTSLSPTLKTFLLLCLLLLVPWTLTDAFCTWPWERGTNIYICRAIGRKDCRRVSAYDTCVNLIGGPYISGYTDGGHKCAVYEGVGCGANHWSVDRVGFEKFPLEAKAIECPCVSRFSAFAAKRV